MQTSPEHKTKIALRMALVLMMMEMHLLLSVGLLLLLLLFGLLRLLLCTGSDICPNHVDHDGRIAVGFPGHG